MTTQKELYSQAMEKWGKPLQIMMAIEEMAELTTELCKAFRSVSAPEDVTINEMAQAARKIKSNCKHLRVVLDRYPGVFQANPNIFLKAISEEMADVQITQDELRVVFDNTEEINEQYVEKLHKLEAMLHG